MNNEHQVVTDKKKCFDITKGHKLIASLVTIEKTIINISQLETWNLIFFFIYLNCHFIKLLY